jgi:outer membrane lipoprotein-sorting protein
VRQAFLACIIASATIVLGATSTQVDLVQDAIGRLVATWDKINTYECTVSSHEVKGTDVQDRVYHIRFEKPLETRVDIVDGDGRGSAAVWDGGDRVRGHQGGMLSMIKLNIDIHNKLATSIRGTTIAQANFGALIEHLKSQDPSFLRVTTDGDKTVLVVQEVFSAPDTDVTKEVYIFGADGLPIEYFQYAEDEVVKHVVYSDLKINIDLPPSTWQL